MTKLMLTFGATAALCFFAYAMGQNMTPENVRLLIIAGVCIMALLVVVAGLLLMNGQHNRDRHDERAARLEADKRSSLRSNALPPVIVVTPQHQLEQNEQAWYPARDNERIEVRR